MDLPAHDRSPTGTHHYFAAEKLKTLFANRVALAAIGVAMAGLLTSHQRTESDIDAERACSLRYIEV